MRLGIGCVALYRRCVRLARWMCVTTSCVQHAVARMLDLLRCGQPPLAFGRGGALGSKWSPLLCCWPHCLAESLYTLDRVGVRWRAAAVANSDVAYGRDRRINIYCTHHKTVARITALGGGSDVGEHGQDD